MFPVAQSDNLMTSASWITAYYEACLQDGKRNNRELKVGNYTTCMFAVSNPFNMSISLQCTYHQHTAESLPE
jgi:hypothetical protein